MRNECQVKLEIGWHSNDVNPVNKLESINSECCKFAYEWMCWEGMFPATDTAYIQIDIALRDI